MNCEIEVKCSGVDSDMSEPEGEQGDLSSYIVSGS